MKNLKRFGFGVLFLVISSCGSLKSINPLAVLTGNSWALASLLEQDLDPDQFSGVVPSLDFLAGGRLAGFSGCNNFSGNFALEGTALKLDPGAVTKKSCSGSGEQDFFSAIEKVNQLKVDKNKLTLLDGTTELMSFIPKNN